MGLLLSQILGEITDLHASRAAWFLSLFGGLSFLVYAVVLVYMLIHCERNDPDRGFWLWIMFIVQPLGLFGYILLRYLPSRDFRLPAKFARWTRHRELTRLEIAADRIGNPYQYVLWGDALRELQLFEQATVAYKGALAKESRNMQALWGSAQVAQAQKRYEEVLSFTTPILEQDPDYRFGDVLLAHGRALRETGKQDEAVTSLDKHVQRWRHPESLYLLAEMHDKRGNPRAARECLTTLVKDVSASPAPIARKYGRWKNLANRMLRKLPAS